LIIIDIDAHILMHLILSWLLHQLVALQRYESLVFLFKHKHVMLLGQSNIALRGQGDCSHGWRNM